MFAKSEDDRFIVKQLSRAELGAFLGELGDAYFRAMFAAYADADAGSDGFGTCLAKILGAFQVRARVSAEDVDATDDARSDAPTGVLHATHRRFGSSGAVSAGTPSEEVAVRIPANASSSLSSWKTSSADATSGMTRGARSTSRDRFARGTRRARRRRRVLNRVPLPRSTRPIARWRRDRTRGRRRVARGFYWTRTSARIWRRTRRSWTRRPKPRSRRGFATDTAFLANAGVMDYRFVAGVDARNGELVVGVVDYLRRYTWDKQLESYVKSAGGLGAGEREPTVVSPDQYKKRFRRAIGRYFVAVPSWTGAREKRDGEKPPAAREVATAGLSPRDDGDD